MRTSENQASVQEDLQRHLSTGTVKQRLPKSRTNLAEREIIFDAIAENEREYDHSDNCRRRRFGASSDYARIFFGSVPIIS